MSAAYVDECEMCTSTRIAMLNNGVWKCDSCKHIFEMEAPAPLRRTRPVKKRRFGEDDE